ncbi:HTTM domain-containing protein [Subsaximicrobium wynnwilliamsii]|uniref:HTTM domain-containing protein n=1 Tax=Subsaximicrobium wynnwilliamsii TaxID=291179 RepID=A0A5C6ZDZ5_9FLAO|nr:HTTM domain-containing protein [Subsaximicrobium wynnwilliamsii]TXD81921.1 HTTM domain-containing protein [Subsaximicrobium wynnwilliamsii]TXD87040.1 HTTM domain-containing protein [Subsaximicrobium wynnwilliamsii]TXE01372.1 HTTM domain-containing protein [Subsaximicrobium wynnwilliamsii]
MRDFLFKRIDNSALVIFRVIFGFLIFLEAVGSIFTGWIKRTLIDPDFTFNFIGFEFLQPLPGNWMYAYYAIMGLLGIFVMVGYKYRWSMLGFTLMWASVYLMQKSSYNNHYYLLMLLNAMMVIVPAHHYFSVDANRNPSLRSISMPNWCRWMFIIQMIIVYTYAAKAKMYPDWLDLSVPELLMRSKKDYFLVGDLLQNRWVHYGLAYGGILFDGLVIPLLLWKPTRKFAFFASIFFHLFNSFIFQVGIFPYLSLGFALFFFEPKLIQKLFLKRKPFYSEAEVIAPKHAKLFMLLFVSYFVIQVALPLRQYLYPDNVLWSEEGHRLSWRMMLRSRSGNTNYRVVDKATNEVITISLKDYLTPKQIRSVSAKPDVIWQFAQRLKSVFAEKGMDVEVYVSSFVSINGKKSQRFIDPKVDLSAVKWHHFKHNDWILPSKLDENP